MAVEVLRTLLLSRQSFSFTDGLWQEMQGTVNVSTRAGTEEHYSDRTTDTCMGLHRQEQDN